MLVCLNSMAVCHVTLQLGWCAQMQERSCNMIVCHLILQLGWRTHMQERICNWSQTQRPYTLVQILAA